MAALIVLKLDQLFILGYVTIERMPLNYYERLGCSESASHEEIKRNFQELVLKYHPDKQSLNVKTDLTFSEDETSEEFCLIMEAWNTLRDDKMRKIYDSTLMREKCEVTNAIFANLLWDDLDFDGFVYSYMCRCGDKYELEALERTNNAEVSVQCNGCSLEIIIKEES